MLLVDLEGGHDTPCLCVHDTKSQTWQLSPLAAETAVCSCAMVQSLAARACSNARNRVSSMLRTTSSDSDLVQ
jgi:hypothetical protein